MKKILLFLFTTTSVICQTLDSTFDGDGIKTQIVSNSSSNQGFYDGLIQTDGKILVGGRFLQPNTNSLLARFNADGTKDNTFNTYSFKQLSGGGIQSVAQQSDGKILAVSRNIIFRLNTDGTYDTSFNTTGIVSLNISGLTTNFKKISTQPDGKIIISGFVLTTTTNSDLVVLRLNSDGSLDTSFNSIGYNIIPIGTGHNNAFSHKIQSDGKVVLVGDYLVSGTNYDFTIIRLDVNGIQDSTFGGSGIVTTNFGTLSRDQARDLEILPSGKILVIGASVNRLAFAMYNPDGSLDTTYNATGKYATTINVNYTTSASGTASHFFPKIKTDATGKFLISLTSDTDYKVIRLMSDGITLDTSFNGSGIVSQSSNTNDVANFVAVKSNGRIITGGFSNNSATPLGLVTNTTIAKLIEINTNGSIYGNNTKEMYLGIDNSFYTTVSPVDQSIFTTTIALMGGNTSLVITKFDSNGVIDPMFGFMGNAVITQVSESPADKITILSDNSIIITGSSYNSIYKLTSSGQLDSTFGTNGVLDVNALTGGIVTFIDNFSISPDNKIVLGFDYTSVEGYISNGVLKLNLDGTIDTTFGTNGYVNYRFNPDEINYYEFPYAMIVENDGKITIASISYLNTGGFVGNTKNLMARLNSDGSFDNTFGTNGKISNDINLPQIPENLIKTDNNEYLLNLKVYTISGSTLNTSKTLKLNYDGSIDTTFAINGFSDDMLNNFNTAITLQPDGKYLKTGYNITQNKISTSRYLSNGNVDITFGTNGEKIEPLGIVSNSSDINYLNDGKILITADSFDGEYQTLTLIKYTDLALGNLSFEKENHNLLIYPNPIQDEATFDFNINNPETLTIDIIDLNGKIVEKINSNKYFSAGTQSLKINLDGLATGNYILRLQNSENKKQTINILKK